MARHFLVAAACLCALALLSGCSRPRATVSGGRTVIRFWNGFTGPDGKTMEAMVAKFERANPDVKVEMQVIPWAQYYDKLTLGLAFNDAPDLFICHAHRLPEYAGYQALRPMDDLERGTMGLPESDFFPISWAAAHVSGRLVGVPLDCHPLGLYYNRALFRKAGIVDSAGEARPPANWQEFVDDARRLTVDLNGDGRPDQWGFAITNRYTNWYTFVNQEGGSSFTPDLRHAELTTAPVLAATRKLRSLVLPLGVAPNPDALDSWMGFRQGKVGMVMEGIYMLADLKKSAGLDYGGAPVPAFGPVRATWAGSHMLCMPARIPAARAAVAWRLLRYLSDHSLDWADGGQVPVRRSLRGDARFRAMPVQSAFARQLPYVKYDPPTVRSTETAPFIEAAVEAALLGIQTPEQAMADGEARVNRVLARP